MTKFVLKNSETGFQKAETGFQNAETRFQNAKTALSRIFFARDWMDSAQKKPAFCVTLLQSLSGPQPNFQISFHLVLGKRIIPKSFFTVTDFFLL